jgi:VIT1/CCC1 family predicted Fe2+/Mn2+ transporter
MKKIATSILLLCLSLSCSKEAERSDNITEEAVESVAPNSNYFKSDDSDYKSSNTSNAKEKQVADLKIIKTADLSFQTTNLSTSFATIQNALKKHKAYVQNDNLGKNYGTTYRNIIVRVPNNYFDSFINEISKGVKHFDKKEISAQDVTEEFVDLEARLKAKRTLENRYLEILKKANKISEILEIEKELSKIREEIEAKEGRLKYLESKVGMSTVSIEMYTENPTGSENTVSYGSKMWNAIASGFNGLSSFFLGILQVWPFILIFVVSFFFIRRKFKNKKPS